MEKSLLSVEELLQIENERELRVVIALRCCSKCKNVDKCFRRDYCNKIYRLYNYYLKKWREIKTSTMKESSSRKFKLYIKQTRK